MGVAAPLIYLDSCIVIYLVEQHPTYFETVRNRIAGARGSRLCSSPLVELECLVGPLRLGDLTLQVEYQRFFENIVQIEIPTSAYLAAASLRAKHGIRTPDALHLATASHYGCVEFWTNDDRLAKVAPALAINVCARPAK